MTASTLVPSRGWHEPVRLLAGGTALALAAAAWVGRQVCRSLSQDLDRLG